jgi:L-rhamnose mutarotase
MPLQRHVLLIDLADDAEAIARYEAWHAAGQVPPEVTASIRNAQIASMEIYRTGNRLVMVMETEPGFDAQSKVGADSVNPAVIAWEALMNTVQRPLPWAVSEAKWTEARLIFSLAEQ